MATTKEIGIACLLILFTISNAFPQSCAEVDRYFKLKPSKYYLLDTAENRIHVAIPYFLQRMEPQDTSLAKEIIQTGEKIVSYEDFFHQKGLSIKAVRSFDQFDSMPNDPVHLSTREALLGRQFDTLLRNLSAPDIPERRFDSLSKELGNPKYDEFRDKQFAQFPYLFIVYLIYNNKDHTLVMFDVHSHRSRENTFVYGICSNASH